MQRPSSKPSKIERASMDGRDREVWVDTKLQWPNGLSIDKQTKRVYWCDAYTDRIEGVSITNKNERVRKCTRINSVFDVFIDKSRLVMHFQ